MTYIPPELIALIPALINAGLEVIQRIAAATTGKDMSELTWEELSDAAQSIQARDVDLLIEIGRRRAGGA